MNRSYDPISPSGGGATATAFGPMVLLLVTYGLTRLAPLVAPRLQAVSLAQIDWEVAETWLPIAAAAGFAVGCAAAIFMALTRVIRELQSDPADALGPALGALLGVVLIGLRAPFQVRDVDSGSVAVVCMSASILGGAMVQRGSAASATLGGLMAAAPSLLAVAWLGKTRVTGETLMEALMKFVPADRAYIVLLALAGTLITVLALLARVAGSEDDGEAEWAAAARPRRRESSAWPQRLSTSWGGSPFRSLSGTFARGGELARTHFEQARAGARRLKTLWNTKAGEAPPYGFSVWRYHDNESRGGDSRLGSGDDVEMISSLRKSARAWPVFALVALVMVGLFIAAGIWAAH